MTEAQLTATQIPINDILGMLTAIGNKDYAHFLELEQAFVSQHGEEVWEQVFNFRVLPALDKPASQWLLAQWMSHGINSIKTVA
ncbi:MULTISPECIES: hypothetical protein [unclassified Tolypothrix]|jgi:hypothetical protein|uniref:hypothetical protein n=1 Tax=unclassified Tolypothrix TaxID=2649714 RepID=UPI0005EAACD6|nr:MULTISPECIES: hypothetical protein [unclassified Tolypothrix]BAY95822.1 hypothetical protein NIES3275_78990 [Microchaete diplosiphon NIES-3275]EKE98187.1 hypothetical protein FDUTEX481_04204 [Tolypothrix sp. PCC 7601]MBE9087224.1 hypothetical protein [Tolypothrix sp. LEGE 11397]QIR41915.1 hypothetical protein HCG51_35145 [Tolypothrix sp. PCC 7910]UYD30796.1 hypothetical protein HGR01_38825 [Tolypothrix sp. PCC 7712]